MEPVSLQPDLKSFGLVVGRQTPREDKTVFPFFIHVCKPNGRSSADGWSVLHSGKCISCHKLDESHADFQFLKDA